MWPQRKAKKAIVVAGCLAMAYTQLTTSPATVEFARDLGANGLHVGILGALPFVTLFMQFAAAIVANHLSYRRTVWLSTALVQRLVFVPLAVGPLIWPKIGDSTWVWGLIAATAVNHALLHFCTPLWLSWMGDYLPHNGLSRFWGARHNGMQWTAAVSLLGGALFVHQSGWDIRYCFATMVCVGSLLGVIDLLLFLKVEEPPVRPVPQLQLRRTLTAPFRRRRFRSFIVYSSFWHFASMVGSPFISLYLATVVGMDLFQMLLLWTFSWIGGAILGRRLGDLVESHGNRPMLVFCTALKSTNMLALLLAPCEPTLAFWTLAPAFVLDAVLNAGMTIATNGFLLKNSPVKNRAMYIAAGTAVAGSVGGATSIVVGAALAASEEWQFSIGGVIVGNFQLIFAASLALRLLAVLLALRVHEPKSRGTSEVVSVLVGVMPMRVLRYPVGLYSHWRTVDSLASEADAPRHAGPEVRQAA